MRTIWRPFTMKLSPGGPSSAWAYEHSGGRADGTTTRMAVPAAADACSSVMPTVTGPMPSRRRGEALVSRSGAAVVEGTTVVAAAALVVVATGAPVVVATAGWMDGTAASDGVGGAERTVDPLPQAKRN